MLFRSYGTKGILGSKFAEVEEKYDLKEATEGFGEEGEDTEGVIDDVSGDENTEM